MFSKIWSDDPSVQLQTASLIKKKLLSSSTNIVSAVKEVIATGVVSRLVGFLHKDEFPMLQSEAACSLVYIAGVRPDVVVDHGAVPRFIRLLASRKDYVRQKAIWGLGNVACHAIHRNHVLECGALTSLLPLLYDDANLPILQHGTLTLSILCQGSPLPSFNEVAPALELLLHSDDETVLNYACLALYHMSNGSKDGIQSLIKAGFVQRLVELLQHPSAVVLVPVLLNIWNIVRRRDHQQTQIVISHRVLPFISNLLITPLYESIVKIHACWTISGITAGTNEQIQSVINENLIPTLVNLAQNADLKTKNAAVSALLNVTSCGSYDQIKYMVEQNCIKAFCDRLLCADQETTLSCLDGLENILKAGQTGNCYAQLIKDAGGLQKIMNLQSHGNQEIREKALKILQTYGLV